MSRPPTRLTDVEAAVTSLRWRSGGTMACHCPCTSTPLCVRIAATRGPDNMARRRAYCHGLPAGVLIPRLSRSRHSAMSDSPASHRSAISRMIGAWSSRMVAWVHVTFLVASRQQ